MGSDWEKNRFVEAYLEMASTAKVRPEAPSDVLGGVTLEPEEITDPIILAAEAKRYAERLQEQNDDGSFTLRGCTHGEHNRLFVYLLNAAELCFAGGSARPFIKRLVQMSLEEISSIEKKHADG